MTTTTRYHFSCYICGQSCKRQSPFDGWVTFAQIYKRRPDNCRYGVAMGEDGWFVAWDFLCDELMDAALSRSVWDTPANLQAPAPLRRGLVEAAVVMATMMTYEE